MSDDSIHIDGTDGEGHEVHMEVTDEEKREPTGAMLAGIHFGDVFRFGDLNLDADEIFDRVYRNFVAGGFFEP